MALAVHDPCLLYLGTEDGLRTARIESDGLKIVARSIEGEAVRAISVDPADPTDVFVGCGLRGSGLYHTTDAGETTDRIGFEDRWVWGVARDPTDSERLYVGTEPPMLYVSPDGGATFEAFCGIDDLPSRSTWTFFHEPFEAGHVHGIANPPGPSGTDLRRGRTRCGDLLARRRRDVAGDARRLRRPPGGDRSVGSRPGVRGDRSGALRKP
jgi:hypothetical protein